MPAAETEPGFLHRYLEYRTADPAIDRRVAEFTLILAILFLLDIISTQIILMQGGVEFNPVMIAVVANPPVHYAIKGVTLLLISIVALIAEKKVRGSAIPFYCMIVLMYLAVFVHNSFALIPLLAGF